MISRFLIFFVSVLLFAGCCGETDLNLTPAVRAWVPYNHHELVGFKSPKGDTITFKVYLKSYNQQGYDKVCGSYNIETTQATLVAQADTNVQINITLSFEALVGIKVFNKKVAGYSLNIQFNSISELYVSDPYRDRFLKETQVNNQNYSNTLHAHGNPIAGAAFAEIYYAKDNGLISLKDFSNNWYYLL